MYGTTASAQPWSSTAPVDRALILWHHRVSLTYAHLPWEQLPAPAQLLIASSAPRIGYPLSAHQRLGYTPPALAELLAGLETDVQQPPLA